jgi:hypothetical protein
MQDSVRSSVCDFYNPYENDITMLTPHASEPECHHLFVWRSDLSLDGRLPFDQHQVALDRGESERLVSGVYALVCKVVGQNGRRINFENAVAG